MAVAKYERELTLGDIAAHLDVLERRISVLSKTLEESLTELHERLERIEPMEEPELPQLPTTPEQWEEILPELFGSLLNPPLVPVCARLVFGMRAKQIASDLRRPLTTVKSQITAIRERLKLSSSEEIPFYVFRRFWEYYDRSRGKTL